MREADNGFTVSNRTNQGKWESSYFLSWQRRVACTGGKGGWLRRWEGVCQQGQEQNSAAIEGVDKDESGNWRKGLLA